MTLLLRCAAASMKGVGVFESVLSAVIASFCGAIGGPFDFSTPGRAFQVEDFVRGEILVSQSVPEPGSLSLLGCGLVGIGLFSHRRRPC